ELRKSQRSNPASITTSGVYDFFTIFGETNSLNMKYFLSCISFLIVLHSHSQNPNPSSILDEYIQGEMEEEHFPGTTTVIVK